MTLDVKYLRGSMAAVFSILKHTACPENVIFHFFAANRDEKLRSIWEDARRAARDAGGGRGGDAGGITRADRNPRAPAFRHA